MNASSGPPRCLFDGMARSSAMGGRLRHAAQLDSSLAPAMLTGRPERRTLRVQVPVRELEARRRKGSRAVRGRYSIMRLSIPPRVQSRSRSREPGSLAGTPKPNTLRLTAQQAGAKPTRVMGVAGPLRIFSETCFLGSMSYERPMQNGWAGSYVCDHCLVVCDGVYRVGEKWLCEACNSPRALSR
jgi:hypothetical protein